MALLAPQSKSEELSLDRLTSFWSGVFGVPERFFIRVIDAVEPENRRCFTRVVDNEIVATVQVFVLPFVGAKVGCIANVATAPEFRKRGISGELLMEAIDWMDSGAVKQSYLFTGTHNHYERYGWQLTAERFCRISSREMEIKPDEGEPNIEIIQSVYARNPRPFSLIRTKNWWSQVVIPRLEGRHIWTSEDAYVIGHRSDEFVIEEAFGPIDRVERLVLGATSWAGGEAVLHGDLDLGKSESREGGMIRGGAIPVDGWFSALDHF